MPHFRHSVHVLLLVLTVLLSGIDGTLAGGYPLVSPTSTPTFYPRDSFIPSSIASLWPLNSTTMTNGINWLTSVGGDPVNLVTGNLIHTERDISVPGRGLPLVFERNYNSRGAKDGPLGFGWTHCFNHKLNFYGVEAGTVKVGWQDGSGSERFFRLAGATVPVNTAFEASPGVYSILKREADGSYSVTDLKTSKTATANHAGKLSR